MKTITKDKKKQKLQVQQIKFKTRYPLSCGRQLKRENKKKKKRNTVGRC